MEQALAHIIGQVEAARASHQPLCIRGSGSKDFYGQNPQGTVLDTRALCGIVAYEPSELVVTVCCGTPLQELEAVLAEQGQYLAFEAPHFGSGATVGGMVAAGLSGPARAAVGPVRDYVLGIQMVNGQAELLRFGGQVMKNVAGYDVSRLMVGALGILGVITEVSLKVLPQAVAQATLLFDCTQVQALDRLHAWAALPLPVNASCWEPASPGRLTVRLRGARAAIKSACASMGGEHLDEAQAQAYWTGVREQTAGFFQLTGDECLWRLSVPDTAPVLDSALAWPTGLVEWGGALRWVKAPLGAAAALRSCASQLHGSASVWRHPGTVAQRCEAVFHPLGATSLRIQRALKRQFDPLGLFNPGRMIPDI